MADAVTVVGDVDGKPLFSSDAVKQRVQHALKTAIQHELMPTVGGIAPNRHASIIHTSIVFDVQ
jgi:hypothetical protein